MELDGFQSDSSNDSDRELQVALASGLLEGKGLHIHTEAPRPPINNVVGLKSKLRELKTDFEWVERLDISSQRPKQDNINAEPSTSNHDAGAEDDFEREITFYKQAEATLAVALPRLQKLGEKVERPKDYLAEMAKSDKHMVKIREKLLQIQTAKERSEKARKLREERKFASKVQFEVQENRQNEKKDLADAVKKHKKGIIQPLQKILGDKVTSDGGGKTFPKKNMNKKREHKEKKFGFGGQKKRGKYNTQESTDDVSGYGKPLKRSRNKGAKTKVGKKTRPGKSNRKKMNAKKRAR